MFSWRSAFGERFVDDLAQHSIVLTDVDYHIVLFFVHFLLIGLDEGNRLAFDFLPIGVDIGHKLDLHLHHEGPKLEFFGVEFDPFVAQFPPLPPILFHFDAVPHPYFPKIAVEGQKTKGMSEGLVEMLLRCYHNAKLQVLLPEFSIVFELVHGPIP